MLNTVKVVPLVQHFAATSRIHFEFGWYINTGHKKSQFNFFSIE